MLLMQDNIFTGISISWQALHITATTTTKFQVHSKVIGIKIPLTLSKLELYSVLMWHFSLSLGRLICNIIIIKLFKRTVSLVYIWYHTVVCGALVAALSTRQRHLPQHTTVGALKLRHNMSG